MFLSGSWSSPRMEDVSGRFSHTALVFWYFFTPSNSSKWAMEGIRWSSALSYQLISGGDRETKHQTSPFEPGSLVPRSGWVMVVMKHASILFHPIHLYLKVVTLWMDFKWGHQGKRGPILTSSSFRPTQSPVPCEGIWIRNQRFKISVENNFLQISTCLLSSSMEVFIGNGGFFLSRSSYLHFMNNNMTGWGEAWRWRTKFNTSAHLRWRTTWVPSLPSSWPLNSRSRSAASWLWAVTEWWSAYCAELLKSKIIGFSIGHSSPPTMVSNTDKVWCLNDIYLVKFDQKAVHLVVDAFHSIWKP